MPGTPTFVLLLCLPLLLGTAGCNGASEANKPGATFEELEQVVTPEESFANGRSGGGFAIADLTGNGLPDILLANGFSIANPHSEGTGPFPPSLLLNRGGFEFEDVPLPDTVEEGWYATAAAADFTNNGHLDLFIPSTDPIDGKTGIFGEEAAPAEHYFLFNQGDGQFEDGTAAAGVGPFGTVYGVCVADFDNDGLLDFYTAHMADVEGVFRFEEDTGFWMGQRNRLVRNLGGGQFEDVSDQAGPPTALERVSTGCLAFDYDGDSLVDLWVPYDGGPLAVYRNLGDMQFEDVSEEVVGDYAHTQGDWMGFAVGDYNGDGLQDVFVTNFGISSFTERYLPFHAGLFQAEEKYFLHILLENQGDGQFVDVAPDIPIVSNVKPHETIELPEEATGLARWEFGWDAHFEDYDNDGHVDLYWNGNLGQGEELFVIADREGGANPGRLMRNLGDGRFAEVTEAAGALNVADSGLIRHGWGSALVDLDGGGALDLVVANQWINVDGYPSGLEFWKNQGNENHWIQIELVGRESNPHGIGARLRLRADGRDQHRAVISKSSHSTVGPVPAHFGLGEATAVEELEILWPSGRQQVVEGSELPVDERVEITEPTD